MSERMKERYDIGVVIGRFQVADLHKAHLRLLDEVKQNHKQMIIMLGVPIVLGQLDNPLPFPARAEMLREKYPKALIVHLSDMPGDNDGWSKQVDNLVRMLCPFGSVCLYGGKESFIVSYSGIYSTYELSIISGEDGTKVRSNIGHELVNDVSFRKGIIYNSQNQYQRVFPTVDEAITRTDRGMVEVFMGRRKEGMGLRFPGGFVDTSDKNLEAAMRREKLEEIDIESSNKLVYVGSNLQQDYRYKTPDARIMTTLFQSDYMFGSGKPKDEFHSTEWIEVSLYNINLIEEAHQTLFTMLCAHINGKSINVQDIEIMPEEENYETKTKKEESLTEGVN